MQFFVVVYQFILKRIGCTKNELHSQESLFCAKARKLLLVKMSTIVLPSSPATFVTIPASNYCEKARWALQFANVPFKEEKHAPLLAYTSTMPKGGKSVPLLQFANSKLTLTDSSDILDYCAKHKPSLYSNEKVKEFELRCDEEFGTHARRVGKFFESFLCNLLILCPLYHHDLQLMRTISFSVCNVKQPIMFFSRTLQQQEKCFSAI
jgi:hypothetical protein